MKKQKRQRDTSTFRAQAAAVRPPTPWWIWAAPIIGFLLALQAYGPALNGAFVFDDRSAPFMNPALVHQPLSSWVNNTRPLLMFTYWINYQFSEFDAGSYHLLNVLLHSLDSALFALVVARFLTWIGVAGRRRDILAIFAGGLFLLHPLQTESVAYVSSRSEVLSVLLFMSAFALWVYANGEPLSWMRSTAIVALFAFAVLTKEHTAMLPFLVILTDIYWKRGGLRKNRSLYALFVIGAAFGTYVVGNVLRGATTAGFGLKDLSPSAYFFTQCRVIWTYIRLFFLPVGQNADADVPLSRSILEHGALFGLIALVALVAAAWFYRKRFPLASYGVLVFLLLLAPTSSFMPIDDVQAERRLYLPFLGLALVCVEVLRRMDLKQTVGISAAVLAACTILTYQRSQVWAGPIPLWTDAVAKSPKKVRPRFQLAYAYYEEGQCDQAAAHYEEAAKLAEPTYDLLSDWAFALDCAGRTADAIPKAQAAVKLENSAHAHAALAMFQAKTGDYQAALVELATAERIDPRFEMTYVYRGNIAERAGDRVTAASEYRKALSINPYNEAAQTALARATRK
jgi:tetratricopeptide (TPR) repeat protein